VTAPHDARAGPAQRLHEARGLRVVDKDEVVGRNQFEEFSSVPLGRRDVGRFVCSRETLVVSGGPVEHVVHPLRDLEERRIPIDDQPTHVDAGGAAIGDERGEKLGHATPTGG
jgi:hypothetical protein